VLFGAALAMALAATQARAVTPLGVTPAAQAEDRSHESSLDEYRAHLLNLATVVDACGKARDAKACDPALVGADDHVPVADKAGAEERLVRYSWLRVLLAKAQEKDEAPPKPAPQGNPRQTELLPAPRTTAELLTDAKVRLAADLAEASGATPPAAGHFEERAAMQNVLAGRDFRNLEEPSARDAALERLGNWLNRLFESFAKLRSRSAWIGRLIVSGFILAVCVGLVWGLLQLERRWRLRLAPESDWPAAGAASARDWQLWLDDARREAAEGRWREAIHCIYWSSISRLEAKRMWPADRARTPREYLALVSAQDPRRHGLAGLTRSFERTWYGGGTAAERDYRVAEELAAELMAGSGASGRGGE
jgi:hypothetical protein